MGRRPWWIVASVAAAAFAVRLTPLLIGGGLGSYGRYDDGVYYAGATALTFGRLPYRDFVFLHPPGILLVLTPFALLGRLVGDHTGLAVARVAFIAVGAANAALVAAVAHRLRGQVAAVVAGAVYAGWGAAAYAEQSTLLEPLGTTALLVALLVLIGGRRWAPPVAGVALGAGVTFKIWYVVPCLVVVGWQLVRRRQDAAATVAGLAAATIALVTVPFLVIARMRMFDMVVRDQLLRPVGTEPRLGRLSSIFGVRGAVPGGDAAIAVVTVVVAVLLMLASVGCLQRACDRILVAVFGANLLVLLASPSYFAHYAHLTAGPGALVLGVGLVALVQRRQRLLSGGVLTAMLLLSLLSALHFATSPEGRPVNGAALAASDPEGCVASDDPGLLVQMNRLSADLRDHCRVLIDVSGVTYDSLHRTAADGRPLPRDRNGAWQRYLSSYLLSAQSFVVVRERGEVAPATYRLLERRPVLGSSDGVVLRAGSVQAASITP